MKLIDADELLRQIKEMGIFPALLVDTIEKMPKIEMVYCEHCKWWYAPTRKSKVGSCKYHEVSMLYDNFCAYGVPKEGFNE